MKPLVTLLCLTALVGIVTFLETGAMAAPGDTEIKQAPESEGALAFRDVARVLQSPRCQNCHPAGDAPLQKDDGRRHALGITRTSAKAGLPCSACHQSKNSEAIGIAGGPPGAPNWALPPKETPMIFQNRSVSALCKQLKDPKRNGGKSMAELLHHVTEDPLVLWGWNPGGNRTKPPLSHKKFAAAFQVWVKADGACPAPDS